MDSKHYSVEESQIYLEVLSCDNCGEEYFVEHIPGEPSRREKLRQELEVDEALCFCDSRCSQEWETKLN